MIFLKTKNYSLTVHIFSNPQNHPTFHLENGWLMKKEEESALLVYLLYISLCPPPIYDFAP